MPDSRVKIPQRNPRRLGAGLVEQAQVDAVGHPGRHREVGAVPADGGTQRERGTGQRSPRPGPRAARGAASPGCSSSGRSSPDHGPSSRPGRVLLRSVLPRPAGPFPLGARAIPFRPTWPAGSAFAAGQRSLGYAITVRE